jgi:hypothetical protein
VYGMVRDQVGQVIAAEGAQVLLLKSGQEITRTPIHAGLRLEQNYELPMRIDQNRPGTLLYTENAIASQSLYSLAVEMNGERYYPIEVSGTLSAGKGSERKLLDLNLGADLDHDGLPDVWEEWQLYQAGYYPDNSGIWQLNLLDGTGDFDRDGVSDADEYVAGTFAGDATETFGLKIQEKTDTAARLEFYQITGKLYTIERSTDLKNWSRVLFSVGTPGTDDLTYRATEVGIISAYAPPAPGNEKAFYRLTVR